MMLVQRTAHKAEIASAEHAALVTEVFDQHIATLAGNVPCRSFLPIGTRSSRGSRAKSRSASILPQGLPSDTTLDGANLTYLRNQPVAQLLYSIGKHRVSVFLRQKSGEKGE